MARPGTFAELRRRAPLQHGAPVPMCLSDHQGTCGRHMSPEDVSQMQAGVIHAHDLCRFRYEPVSIPIEAIE